MSKTLFIGADPEIFLQDAAAGGLVASIGSLDGLKIRCLCACRFESDYPHQKVIYIVVQTSP